MSTVSSILKHVHKGTIENAYTILNGEYEVIEADILETSELVNKELKTLTVSSVVAVVETCRTRYTQQSKQAKKETNHVRK